MTLAYQRILSAARPLPPKTQRELASALMRGSNEAPSGHPKPLSGLSAAELRTLAEAVLAPPHAQRLKQLLRRNRERKLTRPQKGELDRLLEDSDQAALLKSRARYTLSLRSA